MTLFPVEEPADFARAERFVKEHEKICVSLAALVRKKSESLVFVLDDFAGTKEIGCENPRILGLMNLDYTIYHCFPEPSAVNIDALSQSFRSSCALKKPVHCISGEKDGTEILENTLEKLNGQKSAQKYLYKMMEICSEPHTSGSLTPSEAEIFRCTENDMEHLTPLQKEYMKEELAVPGRKITDAEVCIMLRRILKNQLCLAMLCNGMPMAKANTNAIGFRCVQIGGVYTHPLYRRNGYAESLVTALCNRAIRAGKTPVLFVKEKNIPAISLYRKIGFAECGCYEIVYY